MQIENKKYIAIILIAIISIISYLPFYINPNYYNARYDFFTYFQLISTNSFDQLFFVTPNIQSLPFLFIAKLEYSIFGSDLIFFLWRLLLLINIYIRIAKSDLIITICSISILPYCLHYSKEFYIFIAIFFILNLNIRNFIISLILLTARPTYIFLLFVSMLFCRYRNFTILTVTSLMIYFLKDLVIDAFNYQEDNIFHYNSTCNLLIDLCLKENNLNISTLIQRAILAFPLYIINSIIKLFTLFDYEILDVIINLGQFCTSFYLLIVLFNLCLRKFKINPLFIFGILIVEISALFLFVSAGRIVYLGMFAVICSYRLKVR